MLPAAVKANSGGPLMTRHHAAQHETPDIEQSMVDSPTPCRQQTRRKIRRTQRQIHQHICKHGSSKGKLFIHLHQQKPILPQPKALEPPFLIFCVDIFGVVI